MLFSRLQLFSLFFGIVLLYIYGETLLLVCFGKITNGEYVGYSVTRFSNNTGNSRHLRTTQTDQYYKPKASFVFGKKQYTFETTSNIDFSFGQKIKVVYLGNPPKSMKVYTFMGLWYEGILWLLVPTALLISIFAGLMAKDEIIYINFKKKPFFRKMKRIEFDIIRKDEFESEKENQKENEEIE